MANLRELEQTVAHNRSQLLEEANEHPHLAAVAAQADIRRLGLSLFHAREVQATDVPPASITFRIVCVFVERSIACLLAASTTSASAEAEQAPLRSGSL